MGKNIAVVATTLGQLPDGSWVKAGDEFEIDADIASHRWMKRADGKPWPTEKPAAVSDASAVDALKALLAAANERADAAEKRAAEVTAPADTKPPAKA